MGTKLHPGEFDCYAAAKDDEPMFVMLARDDLAPERVDEWARKRFAKVARQMAAGSLVRSGGEDLDDGKTDQAWLTRELRKIAEALKCANDMREWKIKDDARAATKEMKFPWGLAPYKPLAEMKVAR